MYLERDKLSKLAADIPVILLAGGLGTRLSEETIHIPKPMVRVGELPIILHIMEYYAKFGFRNFVLCGGYKIEVLKDYFSKLPYAGKDIEICFGRDSDRITISPSVHTPMNRSEWTVTILETGLHSMTGYRVAKAVEHLKARGFKRFALTYGDGLTDADLHQELQFHLQHGALGTVLGVHQPTRFGILQIGEGGKLDAFAEKPHFANEFINGGYFLFEQGFEAFIAGDDPSCIFEQSPLIQLTQAGELYAFRHEGFWQCMDTLREKHLLEELYHSGKAPWLKPEFNHGPAQ